MRPQPRSWPVPVHSPRRGPGARSRERLGVREAPGATEARSCERPGVRAPGAPAQLRVPLRGGGAGGRARRVRGTVRTPRRGRTCPRGRWGRAAGTERGQAWLRPWGSEPRPRGRWCGTLGSKRGARGLAASVNRRTVRPHGTPSRAHPLAPRGLSAGPVRKVMAITPRKATPGALCPRSGSCLCPCVPRGRWQRLLPPSREGVSELSAERRRVRAAPHRALHGSRGTQLLSPALRAAGAGFARTGAQLLSPLHGKDTGARSEPQRGADPLAVPGPGQGMGMGTGGSAGCREQPRSTTAVRGEAAAAFVRCRPGAARLRPRGSPAARLGSARPSRRSAPRTRCTLPGVVRYC